VRNLAQQLTVSVITTRRAYDELERDGMIYTRAGMGSFVSDTDTRQINAARNEHIRLLLTEAMQEAVRVGLSEAEMQALVEDMLAQMQSRKPPSDSGK
jgi:GntR family transcriptional regulator